MHLFGAEAGLSVISGTILSDVMFSVVSETVMLSVCDSETSGVIPASAFSVLCAQPQNMAADITKTAAEKIFFKKISPPTCNLINILV